MTKDITKAFCPESNYRSTLSEASKSEDKGIPLLRCQDGVLAFDRLSGTLGKFRNGNSQRSCDAFFERDGNCYLFEFKDQPNRSIKNFEIQQKAFDSLGQLLLSWRNRDSQLGLSNKLELFVVFHDDPNEKAFTELREKLFSLTQPEPGEEPLLFGLGKHLEFYFKKIHTVDVSVFLSKYYPKIFH